MDIKELKIQIPEGYEIDKENSTFECIKFKPIKKYLTYKKVAEKLNKDVCFFIRRGKIQSYAQYASYDNPDVANNYRQIEKMLAINQLMNIAAYYNNNCNVDWTDDKDKYFIIYDYNIGKYTVIIRKNIKISPVYFVNSEDAQAVIDNPNFREILNTIYK